MHTSDSVLYQIQINPKAFYVTLYKNKILENFIIEISEWNAFLVMINYVGLKHLLLRETPAPRLWFKSKGSEEKNRCVSRGKRTWLWPYGAGKDRGSTFDSDAFTGPLFLKGGEAFPLADADDVLFEVKLFCVKAQESQPQLSHWLRVRLQLWEKPTLCRQKKHTQYLFKSETAEATWQEREQIGTTFR